MSGELEIRDVQMIPIGRLRPAEWNANVVEAKTKQTLVWVKSRGDYHWQHEICLYGHKPTGRHYWYGDRSETTIIDDEVELGQLTKPELLRLVEELRNERGSDVLRGQKPPRAELHPTVKPVAILEHLLRNSTGVGDTVYDPFAGSGSTLIAAEKTRRRAIVVELDPGYCDVIRERYDRIGS